MSPSRKRGTVAHMLQTAFLPHQSASPCLPVALRLSSLQCLFACLLTAGMGSNDKPPRTSISLRSTFQLDGEILNVTFSLFQVSFQKRRAGGVMLVYVQTDNVREKEHSHLQVRETTHYFAWRGGGHITSRRSYIQWDLSQTLGREEDKY